MIVKPSLMLNLSLILIASLAANHRAYAKEFEVYYLGGQSNMDGYGTNEDLPADLAADVDDVFIFHGNTSPDQVAVDGRGIWAPLQPGHGVGFKSDGRANQYSNRFGVELAFAQQLKKIRPGKNIALIKYSRGGTSIDAEAARQFGCWEPDFEQGEGEGKGVNQYDHFLATLRYAMADIDIDNDGVVDTLTPAGILWMQGESDGALTAEIAARYENNLKRLMDLVRAGLRTDDLPVAIGRISDSMHEDKKVWPYGDQVRQAQRDFVEKDAAARLVISTDGYGYSDPWHYDSAGYLGLGREFANSIHEIVRRED